MKPLGLTVLGPPLVYLAGQPTALSSAKATAVLIVLALDGRTPRESLASLLWQRDRHHAHLSLRTTLTALRHTLAPHGPILGSDRQSLWLEKGAFTLDAHAIATASVAELLQLWRGPFLAGLRLRDSAPWDDWQQGWETVLLQQYSDRALLLADAALKRGRADEAAALGERLLQLDPFSIPAVLTLTAAYRCLGRPDAEQRLLGQFTQRFQAEYDTTPELALPTRVVSLPQEPLQPEGWHLPDAPLAPFIGRDIERGHVAAVLRTRTARLLTLHGPAGIGKTALAHQILWDAADAPDLRAQFERVACVPLEECTSPAEVPDRIAEALHIRMSNGPDRVSILAESLQETHALLLLDNFDEVIASAPSLIHLLKRCPNLTLLLTSRERLRIQEERVIPLAGLDVPAVDASELDFKEADAVHLFLCRAAQTAEVTLDEHTRALVRRICLAVGGSPLGLELAAAWAGILPLADLARELEDHALHLDFPFHNVPERHRSLIRALDLTWSRLPKDHQDVLTKLSLFRGGFTTAAARDVTGATPALLADLNAKALIAITGNGRTYFHPLVRKYAQGKLDTHKAEEARAQHAAYFHERLDHLNRQASGAVSPALITFLQEEEANVMATVRELQARGAYSNLASLAEPLLWFYPLMGRFRDGLAFCEALLPDLADGPAREAAVSFLIGYAWLTLFAGDVPRAVTLSEQALSALRDLPVREFPLLHLRALDGAGQAYCRAYQLNEARQRLREAERVARDLNDPARLMRVLNNLGLTLALMDAFDEAQAAHAEAYALYRDGRVPPGMDVIWLLSNMCPEHMLRGALHEALVVAQEGLRLVQTLGASGQEPILLAIHDFVALEVLLQSGRTDGDETLLRRIQGTLERTRQSGETFAQALLLGMRGRLACLSEWGREGALDVLRGLEFAWTTRNLMVFHWLLPYAPPALLTLGRQDDAADLAAFVTTTPDLGSWTRLRGQREWGWVVEEDLLCTKPPATIKTMPGAAALISMAVMAAS